MPFHSVRLPALMLAASASMPLAGCGDAAAVAVAGLRPNFLLTEPALLERTPATAFRAYRVTGRDRAGIGQQHFTVMIPVQFDPARPCLLTRAAADADVSRASAPRRLDGPHNCAVVFSEAEASDAADGAASPRALQVGLYTLGRHFPTQRFTQENTLVIASPMTPDGGHARPLQPRATHAEQASPAS